MTYHIWGDDWPYWDDLYEAKNFIVDHVYDKSWCRLCCKEKYGTIRYEFLFPPGGGMLSRYEIRVPFIKKSFDKEHYNKTKRIKFRTSFDLKGSWPIWRWCDSWFYRKWVSFGQRALMEAVRKASEKWPHITKEIRDDLEWP